MKKSLAGLLIALLLLGGILWLKQHREAAALRGGFVFDTRTRTQGAADMRSLRVSYRGDSTSLRMGDGSNRWVTASDTFPVDTARLHSVRAALLSLQRREQVTDSADAASLWDYGLNPEDAKRVTWTWHSGETVEVLLGKTSTLDYEFTYWKWADPSDHSVFRTPGNFIWEISPRTVDWKSKRFWDPFVSRDIRFIAVDWRDPTGRMQHYKLERGAAGMDSFRLTEPYNTPADPAAAAKLFDKATQFGVDDFGLDLDSARAQVSLDTPAIVVRIGMKDQSVHTLRAGKVFEGYYQYTQHPAHPSLVWVFKWRFDYFKKRPEELTR